MGRQNTEGCKKCNAFLVRRLAERDETWHDEGHLYVQDHLFF